MGFIIGLIGFCRDVVDDGCLGRLRVREDGVVLLYLIDLD